MITAADRKLWREQAQPGLITANARILRLLDRIEQLEREKTHIATNVAGLAVRR